MRVVSWNIEKNVDAWYHLADKLDPDFAFIQNSVALPEDIDGILIHAANTADENSVIYAKVGWGLPTEVNYGTHRRRNCCDIWKRITG